MSRRLIIVRHAETAWNRERRYQGQRDVPLSTQGEADVGLLRERLLKRKDLYDPNQTRVVSSDLARAHRTAILLFGLEHPNIAVEPGLREYHYGVFEGLTRQEIAAKFPVEYAAWHRDDEMHFAPPNGESRLEVKERVERAVAKWLAASSHRTLVLVTHGGVLRQILRKTREHALSQGEDLPTQINYGNLAVHVVEVDGEGWLYAGSL